MIGRLSLTATLLLAVLASACGGSSPVASSSPAPPAPSPAAQSTPTAAPVDVWNVTARLAAATGGECVGETIRPLIGVAQSYSLTITSRGSTGEATLKSASGDRTCTFSALIAQSDGFRSTGQGWFSCEPHIDSVRCANGMQRFVVALFADLEIHIAGHEITGTWTESRAVSTNGNVTGEVGWLDTNTQLSGSR